MMRRGSMLHVVGLALVAACTGDGGEPRGGSTASGGDDPGPAAVELSVRCERFDEIVAEGG